MAKKSPQKKAARKTSSGKKRWSRQNISVKTIVMAPVRALVSAFLYLRCRILAFMRRRPHRSLRLTRRRDYVRSLKLPGYFSFTFYVAQTLWRRRGTFLLLWIVFVVLTVVFGLMASQDTYGQMKDLLNSTAPKDILGGEVGKAGIVLMTAVTTGFSQTSNFSEANIPTQMVAGFMGLYVWLSVVWLLRNFLANKRVKLRDALYSAGSPILATFLVFAILMIQLLPLAVAVIISSAAWQSGIIEGGAVSMAAGIGLALVSALSLYWVTSTFIALVIITLPGMYPFRALSIAGDVVVGRRLRILYRLVWLALVTASWWIVIMIPVILLDGWLKSMFTQIQSWPIVPFMLVMMITATVIWVASYIYLLYRKVVDDDAAPA